MDLSILLSIPFYRHPLCAPTAISDCTFEAKIDNQPHANCILAKSIAVNVILDDVQLLYESIGIYLPVQQHTTILYNTTITLHAAVVNRTLIIDDML
jgi:hypothetical protein